MATVEKRTSIVLFEDSNEDVYVRMKNGDMFAVAAVDAARACQAHDKAKDFVGQFTELVSTTLSEWIGKHREEIHTAQLTVRERDILFLVMQKHAAFNQQLTDALTDLDISVANASDLNLINLEVLCIPQVSEGSCKAFLASNPNLKLPPQKNA